jgi:hypothetical protein
MKRIVSLALVALLVLAAASTAHAGRHGSSHHHGHHGHGSRVHVAPFFFAVGPATAPLWWDSYYYRPLVYWYCPSARAYYPYVQSCPEPWVPIEAR